MIDLVRFSNSLRAQADEYGDKGKDQTSDIYPNEMRIMYGTTCLVLYALVIALNEALKIEVPQEPEEGDY